jgi:uncharacterized protein (DUF433 family)
MRIALRSAPLPLRCTTGGSIRVGATRVALESVLRAYEEGESVEGIVERFPSLALADVYAIIAWYLADREPATAHLEEVRETAAFHRAEAEKRHGTGEFLRRLRARRPR